MRAPAAQLSATPVIDLMEERLRVARNTDRRPTDADRSRVRTLRRTAYERLTACGLTCLADDAALIIAELTTNALLHSDGREITLSLALHDGVLRIDVHDGATAPRPRPAPEAPRDDDEHGRGLLLVQSIAEDRDGAWGVSDSGATTWCELGLRAQLAPVPGGPA
ncbi:ATP-binding protein [Streptomyces sp. BH055]|uniref:ATP-binding protein n=1 Tax=unclassified Streptomyces TaxID=2593676 RepID=UPI003BB5EA46